MRPQLDLRPASGNRNDDPCIRKWSDRNRHFAGNGVGATMRTIKGPGVFLAQFADDRAPFNSIEGLAGWAANKGFKGVQIPTWDSRTIDLKKAAESQTYCDDYAGKLAE